MNLRSVYESDASCFHFDINKRKFMSFVYVTYN